MASSGLQGMLAQIGAVKQAVAQAQQIVAHQEQQAHVAAQQAEAQHRAAAAAAAEATRFGAIVEAAYLVASADGEVSADERQKVASGIARATGAELSPEHVEGFLQAAADRRASEGPEARYAAIATELDDPELRRGALLLASGVAWLGRGVGEKEGLALQALARAFGIPVPELHKIMAQAKA